VRRDGFIFPTPLATVLCTAALLSLGYLWLRGRCDALAGRIVVLEKKLAETQRRREMEEYKWSVMKSPANIERSLRRFGIRMTWPNEERVVYISRRECERVMEDERCAGGRRKAREMRVAMNE